MSINLVQNFYKETISVAFPSGTGNLYVSVKPTVTAGFLVLSPNSATLREIIEYSAVGTDGTGDYVTVVTRGLGGTTDQAHSIGEKVHMNLTAEHISQIKSEVEAINASGAADASTTVKGLARLTAAPDTTIGTATITIASPAVISFTAHGLTLNDQVKFTTTGALPTGLTAGTTYYVIAAGLAADSFRVSATLGGTAVNTSGSQSGVHTLTRTTPRALNENDTRVPGTSAKAFLDATTGMISMYAGSAAPTGFLLCDGGQYSFTTYSTLFGVVGITYGLGGTVACTADAGTDFINLTAHGYSAGQRLYVTADSMPGGLVAGTPYYVVNPTTNSFQLSATVGGSAIDITTTGTNVFVNSQFRVPNLAGRFPLGYASAAPTKVATFVSRSSNVLTVRGIDSHAHNELQTGQAVFYNTTGSVITGLTNNTTYYLVRVTATTFSLATSVANANAGTVITLTSDGTGTQTFTITYTARTLGHTGGEEMHALTDAEMPSHIHETAEYDGNAGGTEAFPTQNEASVVDTTPTSAAGSDTPHSIMPLFTVVNYIIKT